MDKIVLGKIDIDDARWICSLSDSELDLLMILRHSVIMRSRQIGHEALAKYFDLRMLRTYGSLVMEHLKSKLQSVPGASAIDDCNISKKELGDSFASMTMEDLDSYICSDDKKRIREIFFDDMPPPKKRKMED